MIPNNMKILIVDDYASFRSFVNTTLRHIGFKGEIYEAKNVSEAMNKLWTHLNTDQPIEFIFSDWNMPGDTGLEFLKKIKEEEDFCNLPFVMITAENEKGQVMDAIMAGADQYLIKPCSKEDLLAKMKAAWFKHHDE